MSNAAPAVALTRNPILWGAYLACSWTWCIGMFLPALLLRDMGWAGFFIFALPNVLGAGAMGWFIKSRLDSIRFVENHATAIWWFSAITLAFHLFWLFWMAHFIWVAFQIPPPYLYAVFGGVIAFALVSKPAILRGGRVPLLALALFLFSLSVLLATFILPEAIETPISALKTTPKTLAPLWMFPVMVFGFVLCPYLDITFHHARQQLDSQAHGRLGFTLGFVGFFACMILLTTRYASVFIGAMEGTEFAPILPAGLAAAILIHILCQWLFTVRVHLNQICTLPDHTKNRHALLVFALVSGLVGFLAPKLPSYAGLAGGEIIYRSFLSAYGLIFPAYLLYRGIMGHQGRRRSLSKMWLAIGVAAPFFWLGFIERLPIWLIPGMAIVLIGAVLPFKKRIST